MDNLFDSTAASTDSSTLSYAPNYLVAADNHNIGNSLGTSSWFDPETYSNGLEKAAKFSAVALLSGVDSLYNSGVVASNFLGAEADESNTQSWISGIDDDLGQYYSKNRQAADLAGFVATSFIPGMAGVKVANAGRLALRAGKLEGLLGANLSRATGLLVPETAQYVKLAANDIIASSATFNSINANTVKALASGVWQNVIEGAAFETAVQATMFRSPILQDQSTSDIIKNIAVGGLFTGVLGGAFEAARTFGSIRKEIVAANSQSKAFSSRALQAEITPASESIILNAAERDAAISPEAYDAAQGGSNLAVNQKLAKSRIERQNNDIRENINSMGTGGDLQTTNDLADIMHNRPADDMFNAFLHSKDIGRVSATLETEVTLKKAFDALDTETAKNFGVKYVKLLGDDVGTSVDAVPSVLNLADTVRVSKNISSEEAVNFAVREKAFKPTDEWSASNLKGAKAHTEAEARYIYTANLADPLKPGIKINWDDFPRLQQARREGMLDFKLVNQDKSITEGLTATDLTNHLMTAKQDVAQSLLESGAIPKEQGTAAIAKIVDMKESALTGLQDTKTINDFFAHDATNDSYKSIRVKNGLMNKLDKTPETAYKPTYAKIGYGLKDMQGMDGNVADGLVWLKQQQELYQQNADRVFAKNAAVRIPNADGTPNLAGGTIAENAPAFPLNVLKNATAINDTAGLITSLKGGYGSPTAIAAQVSSNVTRPLKIAFRKEVDDALQSSLVSMGNKAEAAIEHDVVNNKLTRTIEQYVLDEDGSFSGVPNSLVSKKIADYQTALAKGETVSAPVLQQGAEEFIPIKNPETFNAFKAQTGLSDTHTQTMNEINAALGKDAGKTLGIVRPIRVNTNDKPFFAFVKDDKVTGAGHTTMIHAKDEKTLLAMVDKVNSLDSRYTVLYKDQPEAFAKAKGEYEYQRTLNENYVDSDLKNNGIQSEFFPKTDPQKIITDILQQHLRDADVRATELVRMKYQPQTDWLADQASQYTQVASSAYGSTLSRTEKLIGNPYTDITKTLLDVSKLSEYPLLHSANKLLDSAVSKVVGSVKDLFASAKSPAELDVINDALQKAGYNNAYYDAATTLLANHTAPRAELSKFIRASNSILARFTLSLDPLNALNHLISSNLLRGTEMKQILDAVKSGDSSIAGKLAELTNVNLPGVGDSIFAPAKLIAKSMSDYFSPEKTALLAQFRSEGFAMSRLDQFKSIMDDFSLKGTETVEGLNGKIMSAYSKAKTLADETIEKGASLTGNTFQEQFNRFVTWNSMKQLTDLAEASGHMEPAEAMAYRNTFVNRVQGNVVASQRPIIFQGPVGQAVGLFQGYQFNLMQNMFRYVGEGSGKDAAMLLGLQGTMYGLHGMPAFDAINRHVIGTLSGNTNNTDLYDATYGIAGKTAGDFLMYGIPSSITQTNLYTRGHMNPRQLTIIPNSPSEVPIVQAYGKVFGTLKDISTNIASGGNVWESLLQGIEHNGISRPLEGIAQSLQAFGPGGKAYSTTTKGDILYSNDLMSLATLSRLSGGRPLDEAIINDGLFRVQAYQQSRTQAMNNLNEAIKTTGIQGNTPDASSVNKFVAEFAAAGGKQDQFNKHMMKMILDANTPRADQITSQLANPFNQKMQILMGGRRSDDVGFGFGNTVQSNSQ